MTARTPKDVGAFAKAQAVELTLPADDLSVCPLRSTLTVAWEPLGSSGLHVKTLREDPARLERTLLLRSPARPGPEPLAHFHEGYEEFLCLEGRITFDGETWHGPLSYAYFPPRTVHGAQVWVPEGYLLYLRSCGPATPQPVSNARQPTPYAFDAGARCDVIARDIGNVPGEPANGARRHVLRVDHTTGATAALIK